MGEGKGQGPQGRSRLALQESMERKAWAVGHTQRVKDCLEEEMAVLKEFREKVERKRKDAWRDKLRCYSSSFPCLPDPWEILSPRNEKRRGVGLPPLSPKVEQWVRDAQKLPDYPELSVVEGLQAKMADLRETEITIKGEMRKDWHM